MVSVQHYEGERTLAYISPMVAQYNAANADHGDAPTEAGWWVDACDGPYNTEAEAQEAAGVTDEDLIEVT